MGFGVDDVARAGCCLGFNSADGKGLKGIAGSRVLVPGLSCSLLHFVV